MALVLDTMETVDLSPTVNVNSVIQRHDLWNIVLPLLDSSLVQSYKSRILEIPIIENKGVRLAGYWSPSERNIHLNYLLQSQDYIDTFLHELAHCVQDMIYPIRTKAHGAEWQWCMAMMKQKAERCHNIQYLRFHRSV